jgi:tetratricopeptide (TPR) repeat protein
MNNMYGADFDPQISAEVEYSASYVTELHLWKEAVALALLTDNGDGDSSLTYKARAIGAARLGDLQAAQESLTAITRLRDTLQQKKETIPANAVDEDSRVVTAWIDHAMGKNDEALSLLKEIAQKDHGLFATDGDAPAHEMMGDMLLEMNRPEQALAEYEMELRVSPNRFNSVYGAGRAAEAAKTPDKAEMYYRHLVTICARGNSSRPELAHAREFLSSIAKN